MNLCQNYIYIAQYYSQKYGIYIYVMIIRSLNKKEGSAIFSKLAGKSFSKSEAWETTSYLRIAINDDVFRCIQKIELSLWRVQITSRLRLYSKLRKENIELALLTSRMSATQEYVKGNKTSGGGEITP